VTYNAAPVGTYYIRVIGYNGAFNASACYTLRATISSTSLREAEMETVNTPKEESAQFEDASEVFDFNLFPNPANSTLNIQLNSEFSVIKAQAFDVTGRVISPSGERLSKTFVKSN